MQLSAEMTRRRRRPEAMDQPGLDPGEHARALRGLASINFWSGSAAALWSSIEATGLATRDRRLRILDVASGAGDVPIGLWRRARRAGFDLEVAGCDVSPVAVAFARRRASRARAEVEFRVCDALEDEFPAGFDVVTSSLFLHHLDEGDAVAFLRRAAAAARQAVLVSDLDRSRAGLLLARVGTRLLSASGVVRTDGPRSVEGAFTIEEARALAGRAGLFGAQVVRRWPCRWLLAWAAA